MSQTARVLIVEDEFLLALQLEDILLDAGHAVLGTLADSGSLDALAQTGAAPEVALVDLNLRDGLTGPALAHALCQRFACRIIYVTANPRQIGKAPPGAVGVVQKPFHRDSILAAISYMLAGCPDGARPAALEDISAGAGNRGWCA